MAAFQTILGIVLIISAVIIIALSIYNLVIIGKATTSLNDPNAILTDGERKGAYAINIMMILIGLVIGVYGFVLLLPEEPVNTTRGVSALRGTRSLAGAVVAPV